MYAFCIIYCKYWSFLLFLTFLKKDKVRCKNCTQEVYFLHVTLSLFKNVKNGKKNQYLQYIIQKAPMQI